MNSHSKLIRRGRAWFVAAATAAAAFVGSATHTQAQGPVYSVNIVGFTASPQSNEFPTQFFPPRSGAFFAAGSVQFPGGSTSPGPIVRNLAVQFSSGIPVEPSGTAPVSISTQGRCSGEISLDGGTSFSGWSGACTGTLRLVPSTNGSAGYDTEMLALDLNLGGGLRLRKSPTRASTGRTTSTRMSTARTQISSFFDIFTELSSDNGNTWVEQTSPPARCNLSRAEGDSFSSNDFFPPTATYSTKGGGGYAELRQQNIVHRDLAARNILLAQSPPRVSDFGLSRTVTFATEISGRVSLDNGASFVPFTVPLTSTASCVLSRTDGNVQTFDTEMLAFTYSVTVPDASGAAGTTILVRESPTLPSRGKHILRTLPDGNFRVSSFFDIFTEFSRDGGTTWDACDSPARIRVIGPDMEPDLIAFETGAFPPRGSSFENSPGDAPVLFADASGARARVRKVKATLEAGRNNFQLGSLAVEDYAMSGLLDFEVQVAGSTTWTMCGSTSHFRVSIGDLDGDGAPDVAMSELEASATLNGQQIRLRESPTRASKGFLRRQNIGSSGQDGVAMSSFFDVFMDISLDGGTTWVECDAPTSLVMRWKAPELNSNSDFVPVAGGVVRDQLKTYFETGDVPTQDQFSRVYLFGGLPAGNSVVMRRVQIGDPDFDLLRVAPPAPGSSKTVTFDTTMFYEYSVNGGTTWTQEARAATCVMAIACTAGDTFDTEMLSISLNGLPPGSPVRLRESPTRASLGRTSIRTVPGGFHVSSFFDIFTEVSIDGGTTWCPADRPVRCASTDCRTERRIVTSPQVMPSDLKDASAGKGAQTPSGKKQKAWLCSNFRLSAPDTHTGTVELDWSTDFGATYTRVSAPMSIRVVPGSGLIIGEEECDDMIIQGGGLPPGVIIRESPSRQSLGKSSSIAQPDGTYRVSSFFDIFTEISSDGGTTWEPTDEPMRLRVLPTVNKIESSVATFPSFDTLSPSTGQTGLHFADGSSFVQLSTLGDAPPQPLPDGIIAYLSKKGYDYYKARSDLRVSQGGTTHTYSGPVHVQIDVTRGLDAGSTQVFDTEMLAFDAGDASSSFLLRESPTRQSTGQTKITQAPDGTYRISSFFDIFTEISFDGGATWSPSDGPLRLEGARIPPPVIQSAPPAVVRRLPGKPLVLSVACAPSLSPLHFQWLKAGVPIPGAPDSPDFAIPALKPTDAGFYACRVTNAGGAVVTSACEVIVVNPFPPLAGKYNGLIRGLNGLPPGTPVIRGGYFIINVTPLGACSGTVFLDGQKFPIKGNFDADGRAEFLVRPPIPKVIIILTDGVANRADASVDFGSGPVASGTGLQAVFNAKLNPAPSAGSYTALLPSPFDSSLPGGDGYALVKVTTAGAVTISGRAGDNQAFSYGGIVSADGSVPFYAALPYSARGAMQGTLQFRDIPRVSDCDGSVSWFKPAQAPATPAPPYATGFDTTVSFVASRYTAPPVGSPILVLPPAPGNLVIRCEGAISSSLEKILSVSPANVVTVDNPGPDKFAMKLTPTTGRFAGTFYDVATKATIPFNGVVLQKTGQLGSVYYSAKAGKSGKASSPK